MLPRGSSGKQKGKKSVDKEKPKNKSNTDAEELPEVCVFTVLDGFIFNELSAYKFL